MEYRRHENGGDLREGMAGGAGGGDEPVSCGAQVWAGAQVLIVGVARTAHFMAFDLPRSDDCFVQALPVETTEAYFKAHVCAFGYFGNVPTRILYDTPRSPWSGSAATAGAEDAGLLIQYGHRQALVKAYVHRPIPPPFRRAFD